MGNIDISDLGSAGADLFLDSESYLNDLTEGEMLICGGRWCVSWLFGVVVVGGVPHPHAPMLMLLCCMLLLTHMPFGDPNASDVSRLEASADGHYQILV